MISEAVWPSEVAETTAKPLPGPLQKHSLGGCTVDMALTCSICTVCPRRIAIVRGMIPFHCHPHLGDTSFKWYTQCRAISATAELILFRFRLSGQRETVDTSCLARETTTSSSKFVRQVLWTCLRSKADSVLNCREMLDRAHTFATPHVIRHSVVTDEQQVRAWWSHDEISRCIWTWFSYSTLIETMHLSCTVFEFQRVIYQKSPILTYSTCIWHPHWDDAVRISRSLTSEN